MQCWFAAPFVAVLAAASLVTPRALGNDDDVSSSIDSGLADEMPVRERQFVDLFLQARRQYKAAPEGPERQRARLDMQIRFAQFLNERADVENWIGVVRTGQTNREGDRWLVVEIAPRVTLMTGANRVIDPDLITLIEPHSAIYATVGNLTVGEPVVFNAHLIADRLSSDDDMVEDPRIFTRFTDMKPAP